MDSIVTKYTNLCAFCNNGRPASEIHHLCFGRGVRELADDDGLTIGLCKGCHDKVHHGRDGIEAQMSRIIGQLAYEKRKCAEGMTEEEARESFRKRYGVSHL